MMQPNCNQSAIAFRFDAVHNRVSLQAGRGACRNRPNWGVTAPNIAEIAENKK
jgi:hypothetical protein